MPKGTEEELKEGERRLPSRKSSVFDEKIQFERVAIKMLKKQKLGGMKAGFRSLLNEINVHWVLE